MEGDIKEQKRRLKSERKNNKCFFVVFFFHSLSLGIFGDIENLNKKY